MEKLYRLSVYPTRCKEHDAWKLCSPRCGGARIFIQAPNYSDAKQKAKKFLADNFDFYAEHTEYFRTPTENRQVDFYWELEEIPCPDTHIKELNEYILQSEQKRLELFYDIEFLQGQLALIKKPL